MQDEMKNTYVVVNTDTKERLGESKNFSEAVAEQRAGADREITTKYGANRYLNGDEVLTEKFVVSPLSSSGQGKFERSAESTASRLKSAYRSLITLAARATELGDSELSDVATACVLYTWCLHASENNQQVPAPNFCLATKDPGGDLCAAWNDQVVVQVLDAQAGIKVTGINPAVWLTLFKSGLLVIPPHEPERAETVDAMEISILRSQLPLLAGECYILVNQLPEAFQLYGAAHLVDVCRNVLLNGDLLKSDDYFESLSFYNDTAMYESIEASYNSLKAAADGMPADPNEDSARATLRKLMKAEV